MNHQKFIDQLPNFYENWGQGSVRPKSNRFEQVLEQVGGMTTANIIQLLNFAVECMDVGEIYCEVGCFEGATLIGALLDHPDRKVYAVNNFSEFDELGENLNNLLENLSRFQIEEQVIFCNQDFEEFFADLRCLETEAKIGVYFYDGAHDYRSHLLGLLLVKPFLSDQALIIVGGSSWSNARQANWDFIAANPQCQLLLDLYTPKDGYEHFGKGIQVLSWDVAREYNYDFSSLNQARENFLIQAISSLEYEYEIKKKQALSSLPNEALCLQHSGNFVEAEQKYREILEWDRNNADAWRNLGILYCKAERYQEAQEVLFKALEIDSSKASQHYNLGLVLEKLGNIEQALQFYQQAISLEPKFIDAYTYLGNLLIETGNLEQAESIYSQAIAVNPEQFSLYLNWGDCLMQLQQIDKAIAAYEKALQLKGNEPEIFNSLGKAFTARGEHAKAFLCFGDAVYLQGKFQEAIDYYKNYLKNQTGTANVYLTLGSCYELIEQYAEAIEVYRTGISLYPTIAELYINLILALQECGATQEALDVASEASQLLPDNLSLKFEKQRILPILYQTQEEINFYRYRFAQGLKELIQQLPLEACEDKHQALINIGRKTNFYLQCQGKNDLELQTQYGQLIHRVMAANYPQWVEPRPMPPLSQNGKIRVGYISDSLRDHVVGKLALGWLCNHERDRFELYCYHINSQQDLLTQEFQAYSNTFHYIPNNLEAVCRQIIADRLHILTFLDIGMHPLTTQIAGLRLAPVQCTTWMHPITSGLPTINYFLSSKLMEPENAQNHYSEKLVCLENIGISYVKSSVPKLTKTRSEFQLRQDAVVYLSCQSLSKYLPQHDYIFAAIAQRIPQSQFVFISRPNSYIAEPFKQRLKRAFANFSLNSEDYCVILPRQNQISYWNLNLVSDIFLDSFSWSGGHTTLEAVACHLPVVTCPGEFMRGRHSYAILKMLGMIETIANNEFEYIDIAVRLGLDPEWRNSISQRMKERHSYLYDDKTCVATLEDFYCRVVCEAQPVTADI